MPQEVSQNEEVIGVAASSNCMAVFHHICLDKDLSRKFVVGLQSASQPRIDG